MAAISEISVSADRCPTCWTCSAEGGPKRRNRDDVVVFAGLPFDALPRRMRFPQRHQYPQRAFRRPGRWSNAAAVESAATFAAAAATAAAKTEAHEVNQAPNQDNAQSTQAPLVTPADAPSMQTYDPWERLNRFTYRFNARFDEAVFLRVANAYRRVPSPLLVPECTISSAIFRRSTARSTTRCKGDSSTAYAV